MTGPSNEQFTRLLADLSAGKEGAFDRIFPLVYDELKRIAHLHLRKERSEHTLNTTGLVHECYLNLADHPGSWQDRAHFSAIASRAMRRILVDYARKRNAQKRGGAGQKRVTLDDRIISVEQQASDLLAMDEALTTLSQHDERLGRLVECRFFGGMTIEETAQAMDISVRTAHRDWQRAKAYLNRSLRDDPVEA
jgi:RNA polymerase sigma factor (TIGR02999 family)